MNFKVSFFCFIIFLARAIPAFGQNIIRLNFNSIEFEQGLTSYNIKKIIQDRYSYTWLASQDGLNRFDSKSILKYQQGKGTYNISGNDVWDLHLDTANNLLWVAAYNTIDAINLISGQVKTHFAFDAQDIWIRQVLHQGNFLWLATNKGVIIYDCQKQKIEKAIEDSALQNVDITSFVKDLSGRLWCFSVTYGIFVIDIASHQVLKAENNELSLDAAFDLRLQYKLICLPDNSILLGTENGFQFFRLKEGKFYISKSFYGLNISDPIYSFDFDRSGRLWYATKRGLFMFAYASGEVFKISGCRDFTTRQNAIQDIYIDPKQNVWLATQNGVLFANAVPTPFQSFRESANLPEVVGHIYYVYAVPSGDIFLCTANGLYCMRYAQKNVQTIDSTGIYFFCGKGPENTLIASRSDRLLYINTQGKIDSIEKRYPELKSISHASLNSLISLGDTMFLLGSESSGGVYIWNFNKRKLTVKNSHTFPQALKSDIVNNLYRDSSECLILSDHQLMRWDLKTDSVIETIVYDPDDSEPLTFYFDIVHIRDFFYLAVYGKGIYVLDKNYKLYQKISEKDGLCNNGVYKLFSIGDTSLLITTNKGLSVYNLRSNKFKNYFQSDGLHSNAFEEGCAIQYNNLIYAGGVKGFTIIDPSKFSVNTKPPKVYINRVFIDRANQSRDIDTTNIALQEMEVPNDVLQTSIYFSGINYSNPERTTFAYRISNKNPDWVDIGTQNYINLIGLAPSTYHLQVRAANEDGVWSQPVELTLVYLPKWYQTWWFKALLVLMGMGIGYIIYRVRIDQILRQQRIRREVASDLHDDIGSSLNSVKIFAHLASANPTEPEYIHSVQKNLDHANAGLRDMIWILDDKLDTVEDLCNRLRQVSAKPAEAIGIAMHFNITEGLQHAVLPKPVKRNLFLIAKEAINNSIKYAACHNIYVSFAQHGKKLHLAIRDDGRGFDTASLKEGYGIANMQARAKQISCNFNLKSDENGTEIKISEK